MEKSSSRLQSLSHKNSASNLNQTKASIITMIITVVQTALIAWFGFALSGRVELALKERSMTLESAKALEKLIGDMQEPGADSNAQAAFIRKIAMYGGEAVEPLMIMAVATGPYKEQVPLGGLRLVAIQHKKETCRALGNAIDMKKSINSIRFESIKKLHEELVC